MTLLVLTGCKGNRLLVAAHILAHPVHASAQAPSSLAA